MTVEPQISGHRFCVAPMMEWSDRHCRVFHRLLSRRALLYTEMVTSSAIIHGDRERLLGFDDREQPVALQLGGSDPDDLAEAAVIGEGYGYCEINLNVGCPSDRVRSGRFGACLMAEPDLVARAVQAMRRAVAIPVTVKCRIGIDDQDSEQDLARFVATVASAGCETLIIHARKAWLQGLSPKQNRDIPPLDYDRVYRVKDQRPDLNVIVNGGITSLAQASSHLEFVDGVMIGRSAYQTPYMLSDVDQVLFDDQTPARSRGDILEGFIDYASAQCAAGTRLHTMTRHILGLYHGQPGARAFRRFLSENAPSAGADVSVLKQAHAVVEQMRQTPPAQAAE